MMSLSTFSKASYNGSALRNREPIFNVLKDYLPASGTVLGVASGTGTHVSYFAPLCPDLTWQPTDYDAAQLTTIDGNISLVGATNVLPAMQLDASSSDWRFAPASFSLVYNINMIHISEWECTIGLMNGAGKYLKDGGILLTYGPYSVGGIISPASNVQFDESLKSRNANWGIRAVEDVKDAAARNSLEFKEMIAMPANNFCLVFQKQATGASK